MAIKLQPQEMENNGFVTKPNQTSATKTKGTDSILAAPQESSHYQLLRLKTDDAPPATTVSTATMTPTTTIAPTATMASTATTASTATLASTQ